MKKIKNRGFTLIELMIVISIIGVLAVTLIPKLQGAQARSRDAGRIASISSVEAVLNTYYGDEGAFPSSPTGAATHNGCLSGTDGSVQPDLEDLFKGGKAPIDTQSTMKSASCGTARSIAYYPLKKDGISNNGYLLINDVEVFKKANYLISGTTSGAGNIPNNDGTTNYSTIENGSAWGTPTSEDTTSAKNTVYAAIQ